MTATLHYVIYSALLTWVAIMAGTLVRNKLWTRSGMRIGAGNRDKPLPPTPLSGRADRAAANTLENFVIFAALALTAHVAGADGAQVALGAAIFFWARVVYLAVYLLGITYVRTIAWAVALVGDGMIIAAMCRAA